MLGDKLWSSAKACNTGDSNTTTKVFMKLNFHKKIDDLTNRQQSG